MGEIIRIFHGCMVWIEKVFNPHHTPIIALDLPHLIIEVELAIK